MSWSGLLLARWQAWFYLAKPMYTNILTADCVTAIKVVLHAWKVFSLISKRDCKTHVMWPLLKSPLTYIWHTRRIEPLLFINNKLNATFTLLRHLLSQTDWEIQWSWLTGIRALEQRIESWAKKSVKSKNFFGSCSPIQNQTFSLLEKSEHESEHNFVSLLCD